MQAAREAIAEIGFAVIATSLAIGAVFVPVAFMTGIVGRFFYEFGLTVAFAVAISTFIAVTLSPMLCSRMLTVTTEHGRDLPARWSGSSNGWKRLTESLCGSPCGTAWRCIAGAVACFVGGLAITPFLGKEFVPAADEDQFNVHVETPIGTSIEATAKCCLKWSGA